MKLLFTISFLFLFATIAFSQKTPESFLGMLPSPPSGICGMSSANSSPFAEKVNELSSQIEEEIEKRKEERSSHLEGDKTKMLQNLASQTGLSAADMAKLQGGGQLSEAEGMALANRMMGQKFNMSVEEAKKVGKMGKEGQKAWAEGYSAEMMAEAQADPDKFKKDQTKNKKIFDLVAEQSQLATQLQAEESIIQNRLDEINQKDTVESKRLNELLAPLEAEANATTISEARLNAITLQMYSLRLKYCQIMTPLYVDLVNRRLVIVKANLPLKYRLQEVADELTAVQTGAKNEKVAPDLMALDSVYRYIIFLGNVFKYYPGEKPTNQ
jgi:predicted transcriptional regulator